MRGVTPGWRRVLLWGALPAALVVLGLAELHCGPGFDPYDDELRGTLERPGRISFGQQIGPDGDGCWPNRGKVYCDLVSLGGLHWDAGDVRVERPRDIEVGSGFVCLRDTEGRPWCWEWSGDTQPRSASAPEGEVFDRIHSPSASDRISGVPGFVCGLTLDFLRVVCWSAGVDQSDYRQSTHRFADGHEFSMNFLSDDPPRFQGGIRLDKSSPDAVYHAFTGEVVRAEPGELPVLITETLP